MFLVILRFPFPPRKALGIEWTCPWSYVAGFDEISSCYASRLSSYDMVDPLEILRRRMWIVRSTDMLFGGGGCRCTWMMQDWATLPGVPCSETNLAGRSFVCAQAAVFLFLLPFCSAHTYALRCSDPSALLLE